MKKIFTLTIITILLFSFPKRAICQSGKTFSIATDQDFFYLVDRKKNEDRNYTQGTSLTISNPDYYHSWLFSPFRLIKKLGKEQENNKRTPLLSSIGALGTAFTPRIIDSVNPIVGDRPFAFLFALSTNQVNLIGEKTGNNSSFESITINYGFLGTNLGYNFQSFAHRNIVKGRPTNPKGWNTQISKGGKPTFLLNYERVRCKTTQRGLDSCSSLGCEFLISVGGSVGYYNRLYSGLYIRGGWINPMKKVTWAYNGNGLPTADKILIRQLKDKLNSSYMSDGNATLPPDSLRNLQLVTIESDKKHGKPGHHSELFLFSKLTINLMARNAFLVGQIWSTNTEEYVLDPSWVNVAVMDFDFGIGATFYIAKRSFNLIFKNTMRSPEFNSRIFPVRWHYFGSAGISFPIN